MTLCFRSQKKFKKNRHDPLRNNKKQNSMSTAGPSNEGLTITYVTKRIIALTSGSAEQEKSYRESLGNAVKQLKQEHYEKYKIWNVSRARRDLSRYGPVTDLGWPSPLAPPLDRLCMMCKQWEQWLGRSPDNVVVVHSKGEPSRAAVAVSAFMTYNVICANDDSIDDRFSMQRFADRYLGTYGQPSHKRYLTYFSNLLSGKTRVNPAAVYLQKITLNKMPNREIFFKIYEKMKPVYTTGYLKSRDATKIEIDEELRLRGDIIVKCCEKRGDTKQTVFLCQFNTCALELVGKTPSLNFFKEELDLIFADPDVDNQCCFEIQFSTDPPKAPSRKKSVQECPSRSNSYEDFAVAEDEANDCSDVVEYSEIIREGNCTAASEDSGVSVGDIMGPPPVPPKPRPGSSLAEPVSETSSTQEEYNERFRRGILPASVKPHRPPSPKEEEAVSEPQQNGEIPVKGRSTPCIEPDLVGKDRYDKASKCFSYVPAKSLNEAFSQPKKAPSHKNLEQPKAAETLDHLGPEELSRGSELARSTTELVRRPETPKWTEEIDRAKQDAGSIPALDRSFAGSSSDIYRIPEKPKWEEEIEEARKQALRDADPFGSIGRRNDLPARSHSVAAERYRDNLDDVEKPMVLDQAQRALRATTPGAISVGGVSTGTNGTMKRRTNYGSYRMLDNDNYHSDMDDLCDPDFYLNYASPRLQAPKSEQLPRKQYRPLETHNEFDDLSERSQPAASCMDVSKSSNPDDWRQRNCRSVAAAPTRDRKLFSNEGYDAVQQASNPDDWLTTKLRKLKSKRDMDPDIVRRRTQEKMLLEELKSSAAERETHDREAEARAADALEAYKREEERLKNTYSPFDEGARSRGRGVRGKPPTPPPRERSRSPPTETPSRMSTLNSQALDTYKQEPQHNRPQNLQQQQPLQQNGFHSAKETNVDEDFSDFSHLTNILKNNNASSTPLPQRDHPLPRPASRQQNQQQNSYGAASEYQTYNRGETPTFPRGETPSYYGTQDRYETFGRAVTPSGQYISGQERVAAAIARAETPTRQFSTQDRSPSTLGRAETPQFPLKRNETPLPYHPLLYSHSTQSRPDLRDREARESMTMNHRSASPRSQYYGSRRSSSTSVDPGEIIHHHPVFVKDTSKYWYKPAISREQAINILRDQPPGTFVVRDSNSFPGAFGLALKVATPPPGVQAGDGTELVRHFLIEPSPKGVKLKGCNNEPVFGSLSALVYQHSITPLALPAKLILPEYDPATSAEHVSAKQMLLEQGAACNVAYIGTVDCESLTGPACVKRCVARLFDDLTLGYLTPVSVHFKVSSQGVTLTDNTRKLFFRRHYPVHSVIYAGSDPDDRRWDNTIVTGYTQGCLRAATIFAVVARKVNTLENQCHVFAEFEPEQPAHAVLNFINKVLLDPSRRN